MTVFYTCDFCEDKDKRLTQHSPESLSHLFVPNRESGVVICEKCVAFAYEILVENKAAKKGTQEGEGNGN